MAFREDQKAQVQQSTDIVQLIGEQLALKPAGKEFKGLCPFHDDKNPSMHVSPAKQIYKCFSCGAGGDVFGFTMNYHKMTFPEAMKYLAERAGIKLEQDHSPQREGPSDRQLITDANDKAVGVYRALLRHAEHGKIARAYLDKRGISAEMVEKFHIGYAADMWDGLVRMIDTKAWNQRSFELAGLISKRQMGEGMFDRLRHRLIFPILDSLGRPIAFGGRVLRDGDEPKYLNSPETALFNKSATLYGLHLAKQPIIESRTAVIVEGYTDVIACHQAGLCNVVATLGTALTPQHANELRRYAQKVVLIFDADEAGHKAADRAVEVFLTESLDVGVAVLPEGLDPADLLRLPEGVNIWNQAVGGAKDALEYQFTRMKQAFDGAETLTGRQQVAEQYLRRLGELGLMRMPILRRGMVIQRLAQLLHLTESAVQDMLKKAGPTHRLAPAAPQPGTDKSTKENPVNAVAAIDLPHKMRALRLAERQLIGCLLRQPELFHQTLTDGRTLDEAVTPSEFLTTPARALYELLYARLCDAQPYTLSTVLCELASRGEQELADLATQADFDVEACSDGKEHNLQTTLVSAADMILIHHREQQYMLTRSACLTDSNTPGENTPTADATQLLRQVTEHVRNHPSPVRIARINMK